jgi:hypothetical protein
MPVTPITVGAVPMRQVDKMSDEFWDKLDELQKDFGGDLND